MAEQSKKAERKWNNNVKLNNIDVIEKTTGQKVELLDNEQVLPKSKKTFRNIRKRRIKYV